ncbi:hypothetical protein H2204_000974 [Knufia peltigerae]|uniref:Methyltransferase domain-containing protein n=1 Tax=Knufia peltigerae TaxID=1002370 RepID=A0AA39D3M1_9EURO|nr:hypothetical protein H2204_000974 [Knufia peltigerae]
MAPETAKDQYFLGRDFDASVRLYGQHFLTTKRTKWLLHPKVQRLAERSGVKIADVATGNGIWASELAEQHPNANIVGLDISDRQYPPAWTCPENISFDLYNCLEPPPDKFVGTFDIIHIRFLAGGLRGIDNFAKVVQNVGSMLKPGGYLQWQDAMAPGWILVDKSLEIDDSKTELANFAEAFDRASGGLLKGSLNYKLDEIFETSGLFEKVETINPDLVPRLLRYETDFAIKVFGEISGQVRGMLNATGRMTAEKSQELDESERLFAEYLANGGLIVYKTAVVLGRKAE